MCRFIAYLGHDVLMQDVLVKPINSIIMQSLHARESLVPTNGDGFGVGWYAPKISRDPALFTSISPAWNDRNLLNLTAKISAPVIFAHVRAASAGGVTNYNCHPFVHDQWMFMHNGEIHNFIGIKRHLRHLLDDDIYHWIQGETDSEHLFALFLQLAKGKDLSKLSIVAETLQETFNQVSELIKQAGEHGASYYNVCLTDGQRIIASRYCTYKSARPSSLHYAIGNQFIAKDGGYHMLQEHNKINALLVASEKLTNFKTEWTNVPENHLLMIDKDFTIQIKAIA